TTYYAESVSGGCSSTRTAVTATILTAATANAGSDITVCSASPQPTITLSGSSIGGGASTGAWSIISGGGTLSSTAQTANPAGITYTPAAGFTGTVTLRLTTNDPGAVGDACTPATDDIIINVVGAPTVGTNTITPT